LNHYFLADAGELDFEAAQEVFYYGGSLDATYILFPISLDYTYTEEYAAMSASYLRYLIEDRNIPFSRIVQFHRFLWDDPGARWQGPLITELARLNPNLGLTTWQQTLVTPEQVMELFRNVLSIDMMTEVDGWIVSLEPDIARWEAQLGSVAWSIPDVDIDLSSPENALDTWWNAYKTGNFEVMIRASSDEMAGYLEEAMDLYEDEGILEQVQIDQFLNFRDAEMVIINSATAGDLRVFEVQVMNDGTVAGMTMLVRREGGSWKVDAN